MAPRSIWKGSITFGLITIPVKLYTAVGRRERIDLHLLHEKDAERIHYKRVCEAGHEVTWDDIVKGYEYEKGRWVTFSDEELESLDTQSVRTVDVVAFVPEEQIDAIYFQKTYYVAPDEQALKAYRLLAGAIEAEGLVGLAKVAIRQKEHLAAIRLVDGVLQLHTMHWPDEIRDPAFDVLDKKVDVRDQERQMARQLVRQLSDDFRPDEFEDDYHVALQELVRKKVAGEQIVTPEPKEEPEGVVDIMDALRRSVEAAKQGRPPQEQRRERRGRHQVPSAAEMQEWTKDELYQRARELNVAGRSSMDKTELIQAIRAAA